MILQHKSFKVKPSSLQPEDGFLFREEQHNVSEHKKSDDPVGTAQSVPGLALPHAEPFASNYNEANEPEDDAQANSDVGIFFGCLEGDALGMNGFQDIKGTFQQKEGHTGFQQDDDNIGYVMKGWLC